MRKTLAALTLSALTVGITPLLAHAAGEQQFALDPVHSSATFTAVHWGISHVSGTIPIQSAQISVPEGSNIPSSITAALEPKGVDTHNDQRDNDLRSPHFFDVAQYPAMTFASTKITPVDATHFKIDGNLTMHGMAKPIELDAEYTGRANDSSNSVERIAYNAHAHIDRSQWNMTYGNPIVSYGIDISLEVVADRKL